MISPHLPSLPAGLTWPMVVYLGGVALVLRVLSLARGSLWIFSLVSLPGTVAHELCHYLVAWITGGRPRGFSVWPRRVAGGYLLGSVTFGNPRWTNVCFIGLAPLALLPLAYVLVRWRLTMLPGLGLRELGWAYLAANLVQGAIPSGQDLRVAARSPIGWLALAAGLTWVWVRLRS